MHLHFPLPRDHRPTRRSGESGQALIETAVSLTMLIVMLLGAAEIGRIAWATIQVTNAAKAAVQYGDIDQTYSMDTGGIKNAAADAEPSIPNLYNNTSVINTCVCLDGTACLPASSTVSNVCPASRALNTLHVTSTAIFDPVIHLPGLPTTYTLQGSAVQQVLSNGF